ncbi:furry homolog-like protein [Tanacetum coccineum]
MLNGEQIGGKKMSQFYYDLWNIKYLSKFKWDHLTEEIAYKNATREQKLALELSAAKKEPLRPIYYLEWYFFVFHIGDWIVVLVDISRELNTLRIDYSGARSETLSIINGMRYLKLGVKTEGGLNASASFVAKANPLNRALHKRKSELHHVLCNMLSNILAPLADGRKVTGLHCIIEEIENFFLSYDTDSDDVFRHYRTLKFLENQLHKAKYGLQHHKTKQTPAIEGAEPHGSTEPVGRDILLCTP